MQVNRKENEIAVLMAAGMGTRMRPLTERIPKPLVSVKGTPLIETIINGLKGRGIEEIYVVTGYLGEQLSYLKDKYPGLSLIRNNDYKTVNNISSIKAAASVLRGRNAFICEADLYVSDPGIFKDNLEGSCYYGVFVNGHSDDWVFDLDTSGFIKRVGKGGDDCYNMCGISYFTGNDSAVIADTVEERYGQLGYADLFWDEVVNDNLNRLSLTVHPVRRDQLVEIDTVEELCTIDPDHYKETI